jgi:hypothetical protein
MTKPQNVVLLIIGGAMAQGTRYPDPILVQWISSRKWNGGAVLTPDNLPYAIPFGSISRGRNLPYTALTLHLETVVLRLNDYASTNFDNAQNKNIEVQEISIYIDLQVLQEFSD